MFGVITGFNSEQERGIVTASDRSTYFFDIADFKDAVVPYVGMHVYFELNKVGQLHGRADNVMQVLPRFQWSALAVLALLFACACTGPQGPSGPKGDSIAGQPGEAGKDAIPVTIIQLCPGTTTYPSTFVEIAFCLGGKLYGTYSANGGFSTELPPGNYNSNAIGSYCNFTVEENCVVHL